MGSQSQTQLSDFTALCSIQTVLFAVSFYLFNYVACAFPFYSCPSSLVKILLEMFASSRILLTYTRLALLTRDDEISRQGLSKSYVTYAKYLKENEHKEERN